MFAWLRRRKERKQRAIFRYWDGSRERGIDPMLVFRALTNHPEFNWETTPAAMESGDDKSTQLTVDTVREVFGVKPWSESGGLTEGETIALLVEFVQYIIALKKNTSPPLTLPESTEPGFSAEEPPTTKPKSDFSSIFPAQKPAEPAAP